MSGRHTLYRGGPIFDGERLLQDHALLVAHGRVAALVPEPEAGAGHTIDLDGDILAPGFVDLQVNGGGGSMLNDDPSVETLRTMAAAHRSLGATTILPTLITDTPPRTHAAVEATVRAISDGVQGIGGLHLEGPHLSLARKGAHDPALIRRMTDADLAQLVEAAGRLPVLMVTLAPESATIEQVRKLAAAGAVISLGHTDADYETCLSYHRAGARCATHLFNAMSPFGSRAPGLVGAALDCGGLSAGLIADGIHVHPAALRTALRAKRGPGRIFLVSDAMAPAGTDLTSFELNGRTIGRSDGKLTLPDGTLAGADLDLLTAVRNLVEYDAADLPTALAMATAVPARVARQPRGIGELAVGEVCKLLRISRRLERMEPLPPHVGSSP